MHFLNQNIKFDMKKKVNSPNTPKCLIILLNAPPILLCAPRCIKMLLFVPSLLFHHFYPTVHLQH